MIGAILGVVQGVTPAGLATITTSSGVGYEVATTRAAASVSGSVFLHVHTHWTAENGPSLYGFLSHNERDAFRFLMGATGIGPKAAMSIIDTLGLEPALLAILNKDTKLLSSCQGIGKKSAEQLHISLSDKVETFCNSHPDVSLPVSSPTKAAASSDETHQKAAPAFKHNEEHVSMLKNLGFSKAQALQALEKSGVKPTDPFETVLRLAIPSRAPQKS